MTNKDKIIQFLGKAERGYDDDELSNILNIFPRQQVNQICRRLEKQGIIIRRRVEVEGKIRNFLNTEEQRQKLLRENRESTRKIQLGLTLFLILMKEGWRFFNITHMA
jgi:predicted transcriptional regulator